MKIRNDISYSAFIFFASLLLMFSVMVSACSSGSHYASVLLKELGIDEEKIDISIREEERDTDNLEPPVLPYSDLSLTYTDSEKSSVDSFKALPGTKESEETDIDFDEIEKIYEESGIHKLASEMDEINKTSDDLQILNYIRLGKMNVDNSYLLFVKKIESVFRNAVFYNLSASSSDEIFSDKTYSGSPNYWDVAFEYFKTFRNMCETAYEYINDDTLRYESIKKYFETGSVYSYDDSKDAQRLLFVESERIKSKINGVFFANMMFRLDRIFKERTEQKPDYDKMLSDIVESRIYFETFSRNIGDEESKKEILNKIGKTFTINPELISNRVIHDVFCKEVIKILSEIESSIGLSDLDNRVDTVFEMSWRAYFYYTIVELDLTNKQGVERKEDILLSWSHIADKVSNNNIDEMGSHIDNVLYYLTEYMSLLEID